jgi:LPXTG-site transpeptidase (sortase) family protein
LWLEIPNLNLQRSITGVPANTSGWDVTWLGQQVGYLEGTAFPTLAGNTVLTAHVWDASNLPGPFLNLKYLRYGDIVKVHTNGYAYTYQVQESKQVRNWQTSSAFQSERYDWLTMITCESWNPALEAYSYRRVVRAVLVAVIPE